MPDQDTIQVTLEYIKRDIKDIKNTLVTRQEFAPVKNIVFGLVSLIMISVVGALVALVVIP